MKDKLTVEYLSYYKKYRLWNSKYEDWFTNKKELETQSSKKTEK